jgi:uncharacterized protein (TIGR01244 family)
MSLPPLRALHPDLSTAAQLDVDAMSPLAAAGFKSVVNNRPDFEGGADQPTSAALERAAHSAGLAYAFLPVEPSYQSPEDVARFHALIARLPKPIVAFCRTGTRSGKLFMAGPSPG